MFYRIKSTHESLVPHAAYCGAEMQKNANEHRWPFYRMTRVFVALLSVSVRVISVWLSGSVHFDPWLKYLHNACRLHVQMLVSAPYQKHLLRALDLISPDTAAALLSVELV